VGDPSAQDARGHRLTTRLALGGEQLPARLEPFIEYPDSDKIGIRGRHDEALDHIIRRSPDLDYWDGER
jgi:hypothetical protein